MLTKEDSSVFQTGLDLGLFTAEPHSFYFLISDLSVELEVSIYPSHDLCLLVIMVHFLIFCHNSSKSWSFCWVKSGQVQLS